MELLEFSRPSIVALLVLALSLMDLLHDMIFYTWLQELA